MNWKVFKRKLLYYLQYAPFTVNFFLVGAAALILWKVLGKPVEKDEISTFQPVILLLAKIAMWFIVALAGLSLLSVLITWGYYLWLRKSKRYFLEVDFVTETRDGRRNKLFLNAFVQGIRRPLLGFVKGRLIYDEGHLTDKFPMLSDKKKEDSFWRLGVTGRSRMGLPDIKEYDLNGGFLYFEDMLHLFSFAVKQPVGGAFYQPPVLKEDDERDVYPKKTEELDVRIDQMRRVDGEYLNYKDFESGDDVRRIVWKVYAKNRDLVVRVPEMFEPYASHLYFYASFEASVKQQWLGDTYLKEMLNYYKNYVWTVYDTLSRKEWAMRYIPDQQFVLPENLSDGERAARIISNSKWTDVPAGSYFKPKQGTVLCVSSLVSPRELEQLLSQCDASTVVYLVQVSRVFRHFVAWGWFKRLILLPPKDRLNKLRSRWVFSPMRLQMKQREKELKAILEKSHVVTGVL